jgi:hypothetical protein
MIEAILLALGKHSLPRLDIGGRIARLWEAAILYRTAQPYRLAVKIKLATFDTDITNTKSDLYGSALIIDRASIERGRKLAPTTGIASQREFITSLIHLNAHYSSLYIGYGTHSVYGRCRTQLHRPNHAIPVTLSLVSDTM